MVIGGEFHCHTDDVKQKPAYSLFAIYANIPRRPNDAEEQTRKRSTV